MAWASERQLPRCRRGLRLTSIVMASEASTITAPTSAPARPVRGEPTSIAMMALTGSIAATRLRGAR